MCILRFASIFFFTLLNSAVFILADETPAPRIDRKSEEVLRNAGQFYRGLKCFSVKLKHLTRAEAPGARRESWVAYDVAIQRPNKARFGVTEGTGINVISDGKTFWTSAPAIKRFTQKEAPENLEDVFRDEEMALLSRNMGNMLFLDNLLQDDPYAALIAGTSSIEYAGLEAFDGQKAHHLQLAGHGITLNMWVQAGEQPFIRKIQMDLSHLAAQAGMAEGGVPAKDVKMEMTLKLDAWSANRDFPAEAFVFRPPLDAKKVGSLFGSDEGHALIGKPAPETRLKLLSGETLDLSEHKDKHIVVLEFWATWCAPCAQAVPATDAVAREFKDQGVLHFTINQDEEPEVIEAFMKKRNLSVPVGLDNGGKLTQRYGISGIPFTVVIGKDGRVQAVHSGLNPDFAAKLKDELEMLLAGKNLLTQAL